MEITFHPFRMQLVVVYILRACALKRARHRRAGLTWNLTLLHDVPYGNVQVVIEGRTLLQDVISLALRQGHSALITRKHEVRNTKETCFFFSSHVFLRMWPGFSCFTGQLPGGCHLYTGGRMCRETRPSPSHCSPGPGGHSSRSAGGW